MFIFAVLCQSESLVVCDVDEELVERLRKFRLRKETNNAAIISEYETRYISKLNMTFQNQSDNLLTCSVDGSGAQAASCRIVWSVSVQYGHVHFRGCQAIVYCPYTWGSCVMERSVILPMTSQMRHKITLELSFDDAMKKKSLAPWRSFPSVLKHSPWTPTCDRPAVKIDKVKQLIIIDEEHEVSWGDRTCRRAVVDWILSFHVL